MTQSTVPVGQTGAALSPDDPDPMMAEISAETGLDLDELRAFRLPTKLGPWQVGEPAFGWPDYIVRYLFVGAQGERSTEGAHVSGEIRAYAVPKVRRKPADKPGAPPEDLPYVCFTILGVGVVEPKDVQTRIDAMDSRDTFMAEVAHEFEAIGKLVGLLEDEDAVPCDNCETTNDLEDEDTHFCRGCGAKLDSGDEPGTQTIPPIPGAAVS